MSVVDLVFTDVQSIPQDGIHEQATILMAAIKTLDSQHKAPTEPLLFGRLRIANKTVATGLRVPETVGATS